jgi:hypothetical protein
MCSVNYILMCLNYIMVLIVIKFPYCVFGENVTHWLVLRWMLTEMWTTKVLKKCGFSINGSPPKTNTHHMFIPFRKHFPQHVCCWWKGSRLISDEGLERYLGFNNWCVRIYYTRIFTVVWTYAGVGCFRIAVSHFNSLQPVVLHPSSAAKMEAAWNFQRVVMVIGSVVMGVTKRTVVWIMNYY